MGNPIKYLKHVIKDPITNMQEADTRKKELKPLLFTSIGLVVAGVIGMMFLSFLSVIAFLGVLVDPTTEGMSDSERALTYCTDRDARMDEEVIAGE